MKFTSNIWLLVIGLSLVHCSENFGDDSGATGGGGNLLSTIVQFTKKVASALNGSSSRLQPSYATLYAKETNLKILVKSRTEALGIKSGVPHIHIAEKRKVNRFPEASALSVFFIRDATNLFDTWMELKENRIFNDKTRPISKHILWCQVTANESSTSYFVYRPSFEAELGPNNFFPHLSYHEEAERTFDAVLAKVNENPNDQIVFMGLQGGGNVALLHAWMVVAAVPIINQNLFEYNGELHQIKVFLYDSDCTLSKAHYSDFPIPPWDVLRFYSGKTSKVSPDVCQFDLMQSYGLKYVAPSSIVENVFRFFAGNMLPAVTRDQFWNYYFKTTTEPPQETIDHGIYEEEFDDSASTAASELSMTVDGNPVKSGGFTNNYHNNNSSNFGASDVVNQRQLPVTDVEAIIKQGIQLLQESRDLTKFFYIKAKDIFDSQFETYLSRNITACVSSLQGYLEGILIGQDRATDLIEKVIKAVDCTTHKYDKKTKWASVYCHLTETGDRQFKHAFQFDVHVQNDIEKLLAQNQIDIIESWDVVNMESLFGKSSEDHSSSLLERNISPRTNSGESLKYAGASSGSERRFRSHSAQIDDLQSTYSKKENDHEAWGDCLQNLFHSSELLSALNPFIDDFTDSESVSSKASGALRYAQSSTPGKFVQNITLPFSHKPGSCEFELKTKPFDYVRMYRHSAPLFYSVFSSQVVGSAFPAACEPVLSAPPIAADKIGAAVQHAKNLNAFFNSESVAHVNQQNIVVNNVEISDCSTNLPSQNPYSVFNPALLEKLASCLAKDVRSRIYNCNSYLTLWASRQMCPDICRIQNAKKALSSSAKKSSDDLHICSRVIYCDEGIHLGYRGTAFGTKEPPLSDIFANFAYPDHLSTKAYYAAFQVYRKPEILADYLDKPIRFAVFFTEAAKKAFIDSQISTKVNGDTLSVSGGVAGGAYSSFSSSNSIKSNHQSQPQSTSYNQNRLRIGNPSVFPNDLRDLDYDEYKSDDEEYENIDGEIISTDSKLLNSHQPVLIEEQTSSKIIVTNEVFNPESNQDDASNNANLITGAAVNEEVIETTFGEGVIFQGTLDETFINEDLIVENNSSSQLNNSDSILPVDFSRIASNQALNEIKQGENSEQVFQDVTNDKLNATESKEEVDSMQRIEEVKTETPESKLAENSSTKKKKKKKGSS